MEHCSIDHGWEFLLADQGIANLDVGTSSHLASQDALSISLHAPQRHQAFPVFLTKAKQSIRLQIWLLYLHLSSSTVVLQVT